MYNEIIKNKTIMITAFLLIMGTAVAATNLMPGSTAIGTITFRDVNNPDVGMTLNTLNNHFEIHNPSGEISTGIYKEYPDGYSISYDQGLGQFVKKSNDGVYGPNGEDWVRK